MEGWMKVEGVFGVDREKEKHTEISWLGWSECVKRGVFEQSWAGWDDI